MFARFTREGEEVAVTLRMEVAAGNDDTTEDAHADRIWVGRVREILTERGWLDAAGDVLVRGRGGGAGDRLHRGDIVESLRPAARPDPRQR